MKKALVGADSFQQNRSAGFANFLRPCGHSHIVLIFNCLTEFFANKTPTCARLKQRFEKILRFFVNDNVWFCGRILDNFYILVVVLTQTIFCMTEEQKQQIIESGKDYFRKIIIPNHIKNMGKLNLSSFTINPFLVNYLAAFLCGDTEPESLAKALLYPRILGTSINTSFGQNVQVFVSKMAASAGSASGIDGIDIEFIDAIDGRKKYCQCKAGPQTINSPDVATIMGHFGHLQNKARLDRLPLQIDDMIVGVLYGEPEELSANYRNIDKTYPVYCGAEFWEHVTGDKQFYHRLTKAFGEVVEEDGIDARIHLSKKINELADEIRRKGGL